MSQNMTQHLKECNDQVKLNKALQRLYKNRDFKTVILEHFLKTEAIRCVSAKAIPAMQTEDRQAGLDKRINAIGELAEFFRVVPMLTDMALKDIEEAANLPELADGEEYEVED